MAEFSGETYNPGIDRPRLVSQQEAVRDVMLKGGWWTIEGIREELLKLGIMAASTGVSARIRCLRKPEWGNHEVHHRRVSKGIWEYSLSGAKHDSREE